MDIVSIRSVNRTQELWQFLAQHHVASLTGSLPEACVIFYIVMDGRLVFKSRTASNHSQAFANNAKAGLTVYYHQSEYDAKYGVQLKGAVRRIVDIQEMRQATMLYDQRFAGAAAKLPSMEELVAPECSSTFYYFEPSAFKIIDESPAANRTMSEYADIL